MTTDARLEEEIYRSLTCRYTAFMPPRSLLCAGGIPSPNDKEAQVGTQAQDAANRRNAKKSTGPRTVDGKAKARMNALNAFSDALLAALKPVGALEVQLATEAINESWRLARARKIELGVLVNGVADADERYLTGFKQMLEVKRSTALLMSAGIRDPEEVVEIIDEDLHGYLEKLIAEALKLRETGEARLGAGFIEDATGANALSKLIRYETAAFRRRNQALEMLTARQAARSLDVKKDA
jgi:hypothetical protein